MLVVRVGGDLRRQHSEAEKLKQGKEERPSRFVQMNRCHCGPLGLHPAGTAEDQ